MGNNDENRTASPGEAEPESKQDAGGSGLALRFIAVFVISVMALLTGYRYAINSSYNDRYLFYVAKNTAQALRWIGDSCTLEENETLAVDPAEARASLAAWARGDDNPAPEDLLNASREPLTPWERYSYRMQRLRRVDNKEQIGPQVTFVLKYGVKDRIEHAEMEMKALRLNTALSESERASQTAILEDRLQGLKAEYAKNQTSPETRRANYGYSFPFIVISECGAIEVMAIFFAAVFAFPTRWWRRLIGIALGVPAMYVVNILRLTCLGVIGALDSGRDWFEFSHHYVWQAVYIIFVVAVWLAWVEFVVRERGPEEQGFIRSLMHGTVRVGWIGRVAFFSVKFLVFVGVLVVAWWWFLPYYCYGLVQVSGAILKYAMGVPILAGWIEAGGMLNTDSWLVFVVEGFTHEQKTPIALLITNLPPYLALVLATPGLRWARRLRILLYGSAVIMAGHVLFLVVVLRYQEALKEIDQLPIAVIQFYLTLPFLLWIVFAYWQRIFSARVRPPKQEAIPDTPEKQ